MREFVYRCDDPDHAPCPNGCGGEILTGRLQAILIDGDPDPETGEIPKVTVGLPYHVNPLSHAYHDRTGLVNVSCDHGLKVHPDPMVQAGYVVPDHAAL